MLENLIIFLSIDDGTSMTRREIMKIIYKINLD